MMTMISSTNPLFTCNFALSGGNPLYAHQGLRLPPSFIVQQGKILVMMMMITATKSYCGEEDEDDKDCEDCDSCKTVVAVNCEDDDDGGVLLIKTFS